MALTRCSLRSAVEAWELFTWPVTRAVNCWSPSKCCPLKGHARKNGCSLAFAAKWICVKSSRSLIPTFALERVRGKGVCQGVYYIALEYIPGKSLFRLVTDEGPLSVPRAARLFGEVCSALDHAHNQGLIHRDMKPSNIMITPHDRAKVLDLGLALVQGEAPADREVVGGQGYVVGTMDYIAPEQAENAARVETSCDIYSLGCSLFFAMTGQPPFPGGTMLEKIQKHRSAEPPSMALLNPTVAPGFIAIVRKMMAKQPSQRFASAAEVREKLAIWASEDFVLPLDERGDREYQEAVAALEQATPATEVLLEALPVTPPAPGVGDSGTNMIALIPETPSRVGPLAWFLGALGLATLVLMGLAVAIFLHLRS